MSAVKSTTAERLRARRKLQGGAAPQKQADYQQSKLESLWSENAAKMSSSDVDEAWVRLLEDTLPPHKREALMKSYENEKDPSMRYNMLLEFSSYLRQGAAYSGGGKDGMGGAEGHLDDDGISLKWEIGRVLVIVSLVLVTVLYSAYYLGTMIDLNEDTEEL